MEQHRANPVCAGCHSVMDPIGFALENFDAIGRWRAKEDGAPSTPSGTLFNGAKLDGAGRRCAGDAAQRARIFVGVMTEKMMTYALGRGLEYYDMPAVRKIVRDARCQRLPFLVDRARHREQRAVSDEGEETAPAETRPGAIPASNRRHAMRFITKKHLSRRTFLRGVGVTVAAVARLDGAGADAAGEDRGQAADPAWALLHAARRGDDQLDAGRRRRRLKLSRS